MTETVRAWVGPIDPASSGGTREVVVEAESYEVAKTLIAAQIDPAVERVLNYR